MTTSNHAHISAPYEGAEGNTSSALPALLRRPDLPVARWILVSRHRITPRQFASFQTLGPSPNTRTWKGNTLGLSQHKVALFNDTAHKWNIFVLHSFICRQKNIECKLLRYYPWIIELHAQRTRNVHLNSTLHWTHRIKVREWSSIKKGSAIFHLKTNTFKPQKLRTR